MDSLKPCALFLGPNENSICDFVKDRTLLGSTKRA
jgi:hypothetical protein